MNKAVKHQILFYQDNTVDIPTELTDLLNSWCSSFHFSWGKASVTLPEPIVPDKNPLSGPILDETKECYLAFIFTKKNYYNNYFFDPRDHRIIVSFYGWNYLTSLPIVNAIPYFFAFQVACEFPFSFRHRPDNQGCIYDFWEDKTGIDKGLRASYICGDHMTLIEDFLSESPEYLGFFNDVMQILGKVADASRRSKDIIAYNIPNKKSTIKQIKETRPPFYCKSNAQWLSQNVEKITHLEILYQSVLNSISSTDPSKGKIFEQFCIEFFTLIKGWKVIANNSNMPDCEIDLFLDIFEGPKLLSNQLGNKIFGEAKNTGKRTDVNAVNQLYTNMTVNRVDTGILCSLGGITGYNTNTQILC